MPHSHPHPAPAGRLRLAVFDSDGTLADTLPWVRSVYNDVARGHGLRTFSPEEFEQHRGLHGSSLLDAAGVPLWKLPLLVRDIRRRMAAHGGPLLPFPGVPAMLRDLRAAGFQLAVVSSNSRRNVERILGPDLVPLFALFDCGASMFGKASKLRAVLRRLGVTGGEAVYLGDELRDAEAARDAGLRFAAVTWGQHHAAVLRSATPDFVFDHVEEIAPALSR